MTSAEFSFLEGIGYSGSLADKRNAYYNDLLNGLSQFGWVVHSGPRTKSGVMKTLDKAESRGKGTIAYFPNGPNYLLDTGISLNGYSCQLWGGGAAMLDNNTPAGTVFYANNQAGPVIDFKGWLAPANFSGKVTHQGFSVRGSGVSDPTKANIGLRFDFIQSATVQDIAIMNTGGPCMKFTADVPGYAVYLSDFERIIMRTPINAKANDVPYFHAIEANCNRYRSFGFISRSASADCGVSGASVIEGTASYQSSSNMCDAWWFENLHAPQDGCLVSNSGNLNTYQNLQFVDVVQESGATGTCYYRFKDSLVNNYGGNSVLGEIWGDSNGGLTGIAAGVELRQSFNRVEGIKGFKGNNVVLFPGVGRSFVHLKGSRSSASTLGWTDNSGVTTNHLIDEYNQVEKRPAGWSMI